eukprot:10061249-Lingulodinium_polyedra.AAC.1
MSEPAVALASGSPCCHVRNTRPSCQRTSSSSSHGSNPGNQFCSHTAMRSPPELEPTLALGR